MKQGNAKFAFEIGLAVFCTVAAIMLFYDSTLGGKTLISIIQQFLGAIRPIIYGAFIAYLLAPIVNYFDRVFSRLSKNRISAGMVRTLSIVISWIMITLLCYLASSVLFPELYNSVMQLVSNVENYYNQISEWIAHLLDQNPQLEELVVRQLQGYYDDISRWLTANFWERTRTFMNALTGGVASVAGFMTSFLVGIIASIYVLATKESMGAFGRKAAYALLPMSGAEKLLQAVRKADTIFSGFVRGKLLDSLIVGVICFVCCSIFEFPYTPLVSVFVGVTNIIPFFGPFLGAIPSAFLILLADPGKTLYFILFILALQQLDGNVIGPKILGDTTGLSSLWVIIAILVGGSFAGVAGMFFGVPVCACLYSGGIYLINVLLEKKNMPVETEAYYRKRRRNSFGGALPNMVNKSDKTSKTKRVK